MAIRQTSAVSVRILSARPLIDSDNKLGSTHARLELIKYLLGRSNASFHNLNLWRGDNSLLLNCLWKIFVEEPTSNLGVVYSRKKLPNLDIIEKWTQVHHIGHTARGRLRRWITKENINWVNLSEAVRWAESSVYKAALEDLPTTYYMASPTSTRIVSNGICVLKNSFGVHIAYNSF